MRVIRDSIEIYQGNLSSLKRFKDDVKEVGCGGYELRLGIENCNDLQEGDILEFYEMVRSRVRSTQEMTMDQIRRRRLEELIVKRFRGCLPLEN